MQIDNIMTGIRMEIDVLFADYTTDMTSLHSNCLALSLT
jgi:hypothetical protein